MVTKRSSSAANTARTSAGNTAPTSAKKAGTPTQESTTRGRKALSEPTAEELDLRDRMKAQPRRQAGPPLVGDVLTRSAMNALRDEVLPAPTDPKAAGGSAVKKPAKPAAKPAAKKMTKKTAVKKTAPRKTATKKAATKQATGRTTRSKRS
jgi:hypothetical protein